MQSAQSNPALRARVARADAPGRLHRMFVEKLMKRLTLLCALLPILSAGAAPPDNTTLTRTVQRHAGPGYVRLQQGPGEPYLSKTMFILSDPMTPTFDPPVVNPLIAFSHLTDFQIVDDESPLRVPFMDRYGDAYDTGSAYRPQEMLSTQMADAVIRSVRKAAKGPATELPLKFALVTGDSADNMQYNETRWYIDLMDGNTVTPKSHAGGEESVGSHSGVWGPDDYWKPGTVNNFSGPAYRHFPRYLADLYDGVYHHFFDKARSTFTAAGVGIPWYAAFGNHDAAVQGNMPMYIFNRTGVPADWTLPRWAVGNREFSDVFGLPDDPSDPDDGYDGVADVIWDVIFGDIAAELKPKTPSAQRRLLEKRDYVAEHFRTTGTPAGHGFASGSNKGYYKIPSATNDPFQFVALDTSNALEFGAGGWIDNEQFAWLEAQLTANSRRYRSKVHPSEWVFQNSVQDKLFVLFGHHTLASMDHVSDAGDGPLGKSGAQLRELLLRFPNVIMYVAGHKHSNKIESHTVDYDPWWDQHGNRNGFWEISTASSLDWPVQSRLIEVAVGNDPNRLEIFTTMLDADAPLIASQLPSGLNSPQQLAALGRELAANDPQEVDEIDAPRGEAGSRNARLIMEAPFPIYGGGAPQARLTASVNAATRAVTFNSSQSSDSDGSIVSRTWEFGDGSTSQAANPVKTYAKYGSYPVRLTVVDNQGYRGTANYTVDIKDPCNCTELSNDTTILAKREVVQNRLFTKITPARYAFYVPPGAANLRVATSNGEPGKNIDLYVKAGAKPTANGYTCRSVQPGSTESCSIANPAAGYWYIEAVPAGLAPGLDFPDQLTEYPPEALERFTVDLKATYTP